MYTPSHIANFMLDRAEKEGRPISQMKLQKLVYIAYGWALAVLGKKLFDEPILAWPHGPVIRSLYDEFKHYGPRPIDEPSVQFDLDGGEFDVPRINPDDEDTEFILNTVWSIYHRFSATDLRNKTHEDGTPWSSVYKSGVRNEEIPDSLITNHFTKKISQYLENAKQQRA